jgi:hypothetical protein
MSTNLIKIIKKSRSIFLAISLSSILTVTLFTGIFASSASALTVNGGSDCSANSVINCGVTSTSELTNYLPGHTAILDLYSNSFGINQDDVNNLNNTTQNPNEDYTVAGSVDVNNDVIVDGKIVATGAMTAGRENISNAYGSSTPVTYAGDTFYMRTPRVSFITSSIAAFVVMKNGEFQFAILAPCGNPVKAIPVPVTPTYACSGLTLQASSSNPDLVDMSVTHAQTNGPVFKNVTYDIINTTTNSRTSVIGSDSNVSYTFTSNGVQTVTATVNWTLNGSTVSATSPSCTKSITIAPPPPINSSYSCTAINVSPDPNDQNSIVASSTYDATNGATLASAVYDFGDTSTANVTTPSNLTVDHTYSAPGTYLVSVTDTFLVNGNNETVTSANCEENVTIAPPPSTPSCTIPGLSQYAANSPQCSVAIPPSSTNLVNTGPGGIWTFVIILAVAAGVSGGGYYLLMKHRNKIPNDPLDIL